MSTRRRRFAAAITRRHLVASAAVALAALTLPACGVSHNPADGPNHADMAGETDHRQQLPEGLAESVEGEAAAFMARAGTALRTELRPYLGSSPTTEVERGSAVCRPAGETPSIADPERYPFACIVRAASASEGLEVEIVLGFVGTQLDGECWRAANERIAATTSVPVLLTRGEAERPVNQIAACV